MRGKVKQINYDRGFFFISKDDGTGDVFGHVSELRGVELDSLSVGDVVDFSIGVGRNGRDCAQGVELAPASL